MVNPTRPVRHLKDDELLQRSWAANTGRHRRQWQVIYFMQAQCDRGKHLSLTQVARLTGLSRTWVRKLVDRYNQVGPDKFIAEGSPRLKPSERRIPGKRPILPYYLQVKLHKALASGATRSGKPWNAKRVQRWIEDHLRRTVHLSTAWRYLQRLAPARNRVRRVRVRVGDTEYLSADEYIARYMPLYESLKPKKRGRPPRISLDVT